MENNLHLKKVPEETINNQRIAIGKFLKKSLSDVTFKGKEISSFKNKKSVEEYYLDIVSKIDNLKKDLEIH